MEEAQAEGSDTSPSRSLSGTEDRTVAEMLWAFANALVILVALPATAYVLWNLFTTADFFDVHPSRPCSRGSASPFCWRSPRRRIGATAGTLQAVDASHRARPPAL